jgi:hypothetical protein
MLYDLFLAIGTFYFLVTAIVWGWAFYRIDISLLMVPSLLSFLEPILLLPLYITQLALRVRRRQSPVAIKWLTVVLTLSAVLLDYFMGWYHLTEITDDGVWHRQNFTWFFL